MGVQNAPQTLVHRMRQGLTTLLATDRICMAYAEQNPDRVSTVASFWLRRLRTFPTSQTEPLRYHHYQLLGHCVVDALIDQKETPQTN